MCLKTVLKLLLSKFGILSIEMQRAIRFDQSEIKGDINSVDNVDELDAEYIDNDKENEELDKEESEKIAAKFSDFEDVSDGGKKEDKKVADKK